MRRELALLITTLLVGSACLSCQITQRPDQTKTEAMDIDIVPNTSIGRLRLGMRSDELPKDAVLENDFGTLDGISFSIAQDRIVDVWIKDVRTFPHPLRFRGSPLDRNITVAQLKALIGPCDQRRGIIGGVFFNCAGITLGLDINQSEKPVQLRLRPR